MSPKTMNEEKIVYNISKSFFILFFLSNKVKKVMGLYRKMAITFGRGLLQE